MSTSNEMESLELDFGFDVSVLAQLAHGHLIYAWGSVLFSQSTKRKMHLLHQIGAAS